MIIVFNYKLHIFNEYIKKTCVDCKFSFLLEFNVTVIFFLDYKDSFR